MGNNNIVPYDQYVKQSESEFVPSDASSAVNDDYIFDEYTACAPDDSVISELNAYKERVAIYEQRAKFELTTREQEMDDQVSTVIRKSKFREEVLKQVTLMCNRCMTKYNQLKLLNQILKIWVISMLSHMINM